MRRWAKILVFVGLALALSGCRGLGALIRIIAWTAAVAVDAAAKAARRDRVLAYRRMHPTCPPVAAPTATGCVIEAARSHHEWNHCHYPCIDHCTYHAPDPRLAPPRTAEDELRDCRDGVADACFDLAARDEQAGRHEQARKLYRLACGRGLGRGCAAVADLEVRAGQATAARAWWEMACRRGFAAACPTSR